MKKAHREYVESLIGMLEAFKRGKPVQRRGKITTKGKWETFDLSKWLRSNTTSILGETIQMKIHDCKQGELAWAKLHFGIPTASGLDNLLTPEFELRKGELPKTYVYKKVAEKLQGRPLIDLSASSFMLEQGMIVEEEARPWYALEYDKHVGQVGFVMTDDARFGASPDGLIKNGITGGYDCGLEIKSPSASVHVKYLVNGVLPKEYACQVMGSMFATGFQKWIFVSYRRGFPALVLEIYRDEKAMEAIESAISTFNHSFNTAMERISNITKLRELEAA